MSKRKKPEVSDIGEIEGLVTDKAYDERIIDNDFHLHIPLKKLYPYINDQHVREKLKMCGEPPTPGATTTISFAQEKRTEETHDRVHGIAANKKEIAKVADELALDAVVVQPGTNMPLVRSSYPVLMNSLTQAYNDYILDKVVDINNEIYGTVMVPHWDVEYAVKELERVGKEDGMVAAQNFLNLYKLWGDIEYDPIFEKLDQLDLNLILHVHSAGLANYIYSDSVRTHTFHLVGRHGYACIANVINMIMTGVFDSYPNLKVSVQEAGTNWIPYIAYRLDEIYQSYPMDVGITERLKEKDQKTLNRMPSEYLFENFYSATQPTTYANIPKQDHIDGLLKACRAGQTLQYTSDWPHLSVDPVDWIFNTPVVDEELRARILYKNSEEFLQLPRGK